MKPTRPCLALLGVLCCAAVSRGQIQRHIHEEGWARGPARGQQRNAAVLWHPTLSRTLAVWDDERVGGEDQEDIRGRLRHAGNDFVIAAAAGEQKRPALAALADSFWVCWEDRRNTNLPEGPRDIYAAVVSSNGTVTPTSGQLVSGEIEDESDVEVAGHARGLLAVWENHGDERRGLWARRIDPAGTFLEETPFRLTTGSHHEPALATDGNRFLVVWEAYSARQVWGAWVDTDAATPVVSTPFVVGPFLSDEAEPEVFWTGQYFLVTWAYRGQDRQPSTIVGRRVDATGTFLDPLAIALATEVRAKERALYQPQGMPLQLLTISSSELAENGARLLQTRSLSFESVIEIGPPITIADTTVDAPLDPAVAADGWVVWEDRRHVANAAEEDIYARQFSLPQQWGIPAAQLLSEAEEPPRMIEAPQGSRTRVAWLHDGGPLVPPGLIVRDLNHWTSVWLPAEAWPSALPPSLAQRPDAMVAVEEFDGSFAVLWNGPSQWLMRVLVTGQGANLPTVAQWTPWRRPSALAGCAWDYYSPSSAWPRRPALAALLQRDRTAMRCLLTTPGRELVEFPAGQFTPPAVPGTETSWGLAIAGWRSYFAVLAWQAEAAPDQFQAGLWGRLARWDDTDPVFLGEWQFLGLRSTHHRPALLADETGAVIFSNADSLAWKAQRWTWEGMLQPHSVPLALAATQLAAHRLEDCIVTFQPQVGGVGGGEIRVTEWSPDLQPLRAWQWENIILESPLHLTAHWPDGVKLFGRASTGGPAQAVWRPWRITSLGHNLYPNLFHIEATGPAGMLASVRGDSTLTSYPWEEIRGYEPPGGSNGLFDRPPGRMLFTFPTTGTPEQFFRIHPHWLRQVNP